MLCNDALMPKFRIESFCDINVHVKTSSQAKLIQTKSAHRWCVLVKQPPGAPLPTRLVMAGGAGEASIAALTLSPLFSLWTMMSALVVSYITLFSPATH